MVYTQSTPTDLLDAAQSGGMSDHLVRKNRLKTLQRERGWTDAELARQCERKPQQLNAWWNDTRLIGERLARSLEESLKLPRYYLDERPGSVAQLPAREGNKSYRAVSAKVLDAQQVATALPVIRWDQLPAMLSQPNDAFPRTTRSLETFAVASGQAKFVTVPDDSMAPTFAPGDHVLLDPALAPRAGDTVLVRIPSGEHFLRTFKPKTAHAWEAVPLNAMYEALNSTSDQVEVAAVMVEHRRYRAR